MCINQPLQPPLQEDDPLPAYDIKGADGEYPYLPVGHQPDYPGEPGSAEKACYWGGVRHIEGSEEWKRLVIPACERQWKCSMSANFRVVRARVQFAGKRAQAFIRLT